MLYDGSRSINSLNSLKNLVHVAREVALLAFSLPFLHVGYNLARDITYKKKYHPNNPNYKLPEYVSDTFATVPADAQITRELKDGQLECEFPVRNEGEDWYFDIHSDKQPPNATHGHWPIRGARIPNSAKLTREQAVQMARKYFTGK